MSIDVHVGDYPTILRKVVTNDAGDTQDISDITTIQLIVKHPDGTKTTITGSFVTDGTDGQITFTTIATTWSKPGLWTEQVRLAKSGATWRCTQEERTVRPAL